MYHVCSIFSGIGIPWRSCSENRAKRENDIQFLYPTLHVLDSQLMPSFSVTLYKVGIIYYVGCLIVRNSIIKIHCSKLHPFNKNRYFRTALSRYLCQFYCYLYLSNMICPSAKSCFREYAQCSSGHERIHQTFYVLVLALPSMPDVLVKGKISACMQIILYPHPSRYGANACIIDIGFEPRPALIVGAMMLAEVAPALRSLSVPSSHFVQLLP